MNRILFIVLFILPCLGGCREKSTDTKEEGGLGPERIEEQAKTLVTRWLTEVNGDNFEPLLTELWSEDCRHYFNSSSTPVDYQDFIEMCRSLYTQFPVIHHDIHQLIVKDNWVTAIFSARVNHDVEAFGAPATGRQLEWKAIAVFEIEDGKIKNRWEVTDLLGMYEQLGMHLEMQENKGD